MEFYVSINEEKNNPTRCSEGWKKQKFEIKNEEDAKKIFCNYSYSPHEWKDGVRKQENHLQTTHLIADYDDGVTIKEAQERFKTYNHIIITSKNHQKIKAKHEKLGKVDRFHIIFPIDNPITDRSVIKKLKFAEIFDGADTTVFEVARFLFPSPDNAQVYINENGSNIDIDNLNYTKIQGAKSPKKNISLTNTFTISDIEKIRKYCPAVDNAFKSVETDKATGAAGHNERLLVASTIKNTTGDEEYVKSLFSNLSDYDEKITINHYMSITGGGFKCETIIGNGLCPSRCELMEDIGKSLPIAFVYRNGAALLTNDELLTNVERSENFQELIKRLKLSTDLIKENKLIAKLSAESGLSKTEIKAEIKRATVIDDEKPYVINGRVHEVKAAEYIIEKEKIIRYQEDYYLYKGGIYKKISKEEMESIIHNEIKKWSNNHTVLETINAVKREGFLSEEKVKKANNPREIACNNGLFNVKKREFRDFTESDYRFQKMNANYTPSAKCPKFEEVIFDIFDGDNDAQQKTELLQEIMGYLLIPDYTLIKKMFYFFGPKANNGKSTVLDIIRAVMGSDYIDSVPLNKLENFMLKRLAGKHANIVGDQDVASKVPDGVIKQLIGGRDKLTADVKFKEAINFKNYARLIFAVNKLPFSQAKDKGYYTRVEILTFNNEFVPNPVGNQKKADPEKIDQIIEKELDGILNWALIGLKRVLENKTLTSVPSSVKALEKYKKENNSVLSYVKESCEIRKGVSKNKTQLYNDYKRWCKQNGFSKFLNSSNFFNTIKSEFNVKEKRTNRERLFEGIEIVNETRIAMFQ